MRIMRIVRKNRWKSDCERNRSILEAILICGLFVVTLLVATKCDYEQPIVATTAIQLQMSTYNAHFEKTVLENRKNFAKLQKKYDDQNLLKKLEAAR